MTINEKINNFKERAITDANLQSQSIIHECEENIKKQLEEYKKKAEADFNSKLQSESEEIMKNNNKKLSSDTVILKQKLEKRRLELIASLFDELKKKLIEYKKTSDYQDLLLKQIEQIEQYSEGSDFVIYIDNSDSDLLDKLSTKSKHKIEISPNNLLGGVRGIIKSENILLDYSFSNKLMEEKANFSF